MELIFISFHHYENISSCYFHKHLFPYHDKTFPHFTKLESVDKGRVEAWRSHVLKSFSILDFHLEYYIPESKKYHFVYHIFNPLQNHCAGKWNDMLVIQPNKYN